MQKNPTPRPHHPQIKKFSQLLFPPTKQPPADAETINHRLLVQAGFVRQIMAGVYAYTDLGLRVLNKISDIVAEEMHSLESHQIQMSALTPKANWVQTGGWDDIDVLFHVPSQTHKEYALAQSHEEIITPMMKERIQSLKDLPLSVFQIQWKFRDELRAKSGILRGREFLMKDMYSFHATQEDFLNYYEQVKTVYLKTFARLGLDAKATEASGGNFTEKISYEYMVLTDAGEDDIFYCPHCDYAINEEIATDELKKSPICPKCQSKLEFGRASEAGNVFDLGTKFTQAFDLAVRNSDGDKIYPIMGCYGIGISRAMGIVVEKNADDKGIIWPKEIAPYQVEIIGLGDEEKQQAAALLAEELVAKGIEVLIDDREDVSAGAKFAGADLIGCPYRLVISAKTEDKIEVKDRQEKEVKLMTKAEVFDLLAEQNEV